MRNVIVYCVLMTLFDIVNVDACSYLFVRSVTR